MDRIGRAVLRLNRQLIDFGKESLNVGAEFEQAVANFRSVLPAADQAGQAFDDLKQKVIELGVSTVFTARQVAEATENLAKAGFDAADSIEALPKVLELAAAGSLSMEKAAAVAVTGLKGFGLQADQLGGFVDSLASGAANANIDVQGLGKAFSFAAGPLNLLDQTIPDVVSGISALANVGIPASRSGRNLASAFADLVVFGGRVGLTMKDSAGKVISLADAIQQVEEKGLTATDIFANFSKETARTILLLTQTGSEGLRELASQVDSTAISMSELKDIAQITGTAFEPLRLAYEGAGEKAKELELTSASLVTGLLALEDANITGSKAADLVNTALDQLATKSKAAGVNILNSTGGLKDLNGILKVLDPTIFTSAKLTETFGAETAKLVTILRTQGIDALADTTTELRNLTGAAEGAAARMADMKLDTLSGDVEKFKAALEETRVVIFDLGLGELARTLTQGFTDMLKQVSETIRDNSESVESFFDDLNKKAINSNGKPQGTGNSYYHSLW